MKLGEIAEIKTGLVLTRKKANIKYEVKDKYNLLTLNNIETDGVFNNKPFEIFLSNAKLDKQYFTQEEDILIRLSQPNTAVYIDENKVGLLVPSYFAIIKLKTEDFIPQYITWYLNSNRFKKELLRYQTGSTITTTNISILKSINIKVIPMEKQKQIAKLQKLHLREKYLLKQLIDEKEKYYKAITNKLLKEN